MGDAMTIPTPDEVANAMRVPPGSADFRLDSRPTKVSGVFDDKAEAIATLADDAQAINTLQDALYAEGRRALLIVLQGMDTSGKDGTIRGVFRETDPLGVKIAAFGKPTEHELARDYLWRVHQAIPPKGHIGVFNRSHYEDVLVVKVRSLAPADAVEQRYDQINAFEKHLTENGITILKFMLHLSQEEQLKNLRDRLEKPHKRWKFNPNDLEDRKLWPAFHDAYETMLRRCSTEHAPWYVVPADSKSRRNALIGRIVRGTLEAMNPAYPDPGLRVGDFPVFADGAGD